MKISVFHPHLSQNMFTEVHLQSAVHFGISCRSQVLHVPMVTCWNFSFDAVLRINVKSSADLNELCIRFEFHSFSFLKDYHKVFRPLGRGFDILQGEDKCFYGTLLPTSEQFLRKEKMKTEISLATLVLAICIEDPILQCFSRVLESRDVILAAISLLKVKLKWVKEQVKTDQYKQTFIDEMRKYNDEMSIV